jgi:type I restriction enzyme S subunit
MKLKEYILSDCCKSITDGDHQAPPKSTTGIPFITISNIHNNQIDFSDTMYVPKEYYKNLDNTKVARPGDILYSVVGSFGIPVLIQDDRNFVFQRHIAILKPNANVVDARYLYYIMLSREFYKQADSVALGAAQRTISLSALRNMRIKLPSIKEQKLISDVLSVYDELIENNQKQIKLLEEAAQRLYKEWFVDLHFPGYENTKIIDGIPEGWQIGELADLFDYVGKREKKSNRNSYSCYLPIDAIPKKSLTYVFTKSVDEAKSSLVGFSKGNIIFGAMRPYFHKVVIAKSDGLTRSTCFVLNTKNKEMYAYGVMTMFRKDTINYATKISVGTTMPYVKWNDMQHMKVIIPSNKQLIPFNKNIMPIIYSMQKISDEIKLLSEARDRLLPKLMSGEIEV